MNVSRAVMLVIALLVSDAASSRTVFSDERNGKNFALLVGCTRYARLPQRQHLGGPANDVVLMHRLLRDRFGFAAEDIVVLAEQDDLDEARAAYDVDQEISCEQPTAARIESAFDELVGKVAQGDQVFILLAGHGSQQPDLDPGRDVEPDGFDEVFLPRDIGRWTSSTQAVENAITDDQLGAWTAEMVNSGAFVFFVADSCHSGTVTRGSDDVTSRDVSRETLGIPEDAAISDVVPIVGTDDVPTTGWLDAAERAGGTAGLVALYAAQSNEEAIEFRPNATGPKHGRLSYAICETFEECDRAITYSELKQRLLWTYTQRQWTSRSTPDMEGTDLDREVLGVRTWQGRSDLTIESDQGQFTVSGGALHRITRNSILAVHPPAGTGDADEIIGYVIVTDSRPFTAVVEPIAFAGVEPPTSLPDHARCVIRHHDPGDLQVTVAVDADGFLVDDAAQAAKTELEQALTAISTGEEALFRVVDQSASADWYAVVTPEEIWLQKSGSRFELNDVDELDAGLRSGEVLGPLAAARGVEIDEIVSRHFERIAWASNLIALSNQAESHENPLVDIQLKVMRDNPAGEPVEFRPGEEAESRVRDGERMLLTVMNNGLEPVSLVVFYVDAHHTVDLFFPDFRFRDEELNNRIGVGESLYKEINFNINASTVGWEHILVFAVPATDQETIRSLKNLQQAGLGAQARGAVGPGASPLARLVERAAGGTRGASRGDTAPEVGSYAIRRIMWQVVDDD